MQDTAKVATKVAQTVGAVLDELGKRLGGTGAHLWTILVRQAYVSAIEFTLLAAVSLVVAVSIYRKCVKAWGEYKEKKKNSGYYGDGPEGLTVLCSITGLVAFILTGFAIHALATLANPEYFALTTVLDALHGK